MAAASSRNSTIRRIPGETNSHRLAHSNSGGELSASRVNLLPHQILLVHDLVEMAERRMLVADEVGLGKTIETGMLLRELNARAKE